MPQNTLYNGIELSAPWPPPDLSVDSTAQLPTPYLESLPEVIPIDVGRQLFVDDFLIESSDLRRVFHRADLVGDRPIFEPATDLEMNRGDCPVALPPSQRATFRVLDQPG